MKILESTVCLSIDSICQENEFHHKKNYIMKKITNKHLQLNKINVSKLNAVLGGNPTKNPSKETHDCPEETEGDTCTTSRTTVDFGSNNTSC